MFLNIVFIICLFGFVVGLCYTIYTWLSWSKLEAVFYKLNQTKAVVKRSKVFFKEIWKDNSAVHQDLLWQIGLISAVFIGLIGFSLFQSIFGILAAPFGFIYGPRLWIFWQKKRVKRAFEKSMTRITKSLANATKGNATPIKAFEYAKSEAPELIKPYLQMVIDKEGNGIPLQFAVRDMAEMLDIPEAYLLANAVGMQIELGGNAAELYESAGEMASYRMRKRKLVSSRTKKIKFEGILSNAFPIFLYFLMAFSTRGEYWEMMFIPRGRILLFIAFTLDVICMMIVLRIVKQASEIKTKKM